MRHVDVITKTKLLLQKANISMTDDFLMNRVNYVFSVTENTLL
jgi:hypothetical protein